MEPIISPWIIYAVDILDKLSIFARLMLLILTAAFIMVGMVYIEYGGEDVRELLHKMKWAAIISIAVIVFIPDKETMLTMLAAQYITPDNLQAMQGNVVEFVKQIAEAAKL